jgi:hypothetical protein
MELLTDKYRDKIAGELSCYDRIVFTGTIKNISYAQGMTSYLYKNKIRIFDYPKLATPLRDVIRNNAEKLAKENNIEIEFVKEADKGDCGNRIG